jgi:hypothetical protein
VESDLYAEPVNGIQLLQAYGRAFPPVIPRSLKRQGMQA